MHTEDLYKHPEFSSGGYDMIKGKPQWFKLWAQKYAAALDIFNLEYDLSPEEMEDLFKDVGRAFLTAISYFVADYGDGSFKEYTPETRDGRIIWNALKRDIDQSYRDYEKRVANGSLGGRPRTN